MRAGRSYVITVLVLVTHVLGQEKWVCPQRPTNGGQRAATPPTNAPEDPGTYFLGTVKLWVVVDPKGHARDARVIQGLDKEINRDAEKAAREWAFDPAKKDGQPVAVQIMLEMDYWRHRGITFRCPNTPVAVTLGKEGQKKSRS
jgi:TonB family protein